MNYLYFKISCRVYHCAPCEVCIGCCFHVRTVISEGRRQNVALLNCETVSSVQVISARKGEFETGFDRGGQTREHAMLAKTAGVKHLVVLVNKMDDPTVEWSEARYNECRDKIMPYLRKLGFNPQKDLTFMPCSGLTGLGLKDPLDEKLCPWYR